MVAEPAGTPKPLTYTIDSGDRLASVDAAFRRFALENGWPEGAGTSILGRPVWSFVADAETRLLWGALLARCRSGHPVRVTIRCDAPAERRLLELRLESSPGGDVTIRSTTLAASPRVAQHVWSAAPAAGLPPVLACGWCKRLRAPGGRWLEVEEAAEELGLLRAPAPPLLSHGICPDCDRDVREKAGLAGAEPG